MMQIKLFGGTFTCDEDDERYECYSTYLVNYTFIAKIGDIYFRFYLDRDTGSFILKYGKIEISQPININDKKGDTIQSLMQRTASIFEEEYKKLNIEKTLELQIFE